MRTFLTILVAATLLGHALIECNWHSGNTCSGCGTDVASAMVPPACCEHRSPTADGQRPSPDRPCDCQLNGGGCDYLPPQKTLLDAWQLLSPLDAVALASPSCQDSLPGRLWQRAGGRGDPEPPLRLHLLHQILLI